MLDLPGPGTEPASPALAYRFFTPEPPGKPFLFFAVYLEPNLVDSVSVDGDKAFKNGI